MEVAVATMGAGYALVSSADVFSDADFDSHRQESLRTPQELDGFIEAFVTGCQIHVGRTALLGIVFHLVAGSRI